MPALEISTARDAQRLRCPNGHVVEPTNEHWFCHACSTHWTSCESDFDRVRDAETGLMVSRDDVRFTGDARHRVPY